MRWNLTVRKAVTTGTMFLPLTLIGFLFSGVSMADCFVEDGTFYANSKSTMTAFAIYMDEGKKDDAIRMVDDGRIKSCSQASAMVLKDESPLLKVHIVGIGKVWIFETFLHCR